MSDKNVSWQALFMSMPIKSVWLGLNFEEAAFENIKESYACETYAVELCTREQAHLSVFLAAPVFEIPGVIPVRDLFRAGMRQLMRSTPIVAPMLKRPKGEL
jgi:hypothetical protein